MLSSSCLLQLSRPASWPYHMMESSNPDDKVGGFPLRHVKAPSPLPPVIRDPKLPPPISVGPPDSWKLLIKLPTRARPAKALATLELYRSMARAEPKPQFLVVLDHDDETMKTGSVVDALSQSDVEVVTGEHKTKIEAYNAGVSERPWDIVVLASDDMIPEVDGYDQIIRDKMREHYPDLDGVLWFNDGFNATVLDTLSIMGRWYYDRFGYLYYPQYKSLWADNEFQEVAQRNGKITYFPQVIIRHHHWVYRLRSRDATDDGGATDNSHDKALFQERQNKGFGA